MEPTDSHSPDARAEAARLAREGRWREAIPLLEGALGRSPADPALLNLLGLAFRQEGRFPEGEGCFQKALAAGGAPIETLTNLGCLYASSGKEAEAEAAFHRALALSRAAPMAWYNLANLWLAQGRLASAAAAFHEALKTAPEVPEIHLNLGIALLQMGRGEQALPALAQAARLRPSFLEAHSNRLMTMNYLPGCRVEELRQAHQDFGRWLEAWLPAQPPAPVPASRPERIRLAYLSSDLREHATANFIEPVLEQHDRSRFEIACYASGPPEDARSARLRRNVDRWVDARPLDDAALADRIRWDGIHVLVDLGGHSAANRIGVLARKPAPVQYAWIGYPEQTGLQRVDARLTDRTMDPEAEDHLPGRDPVRRLRRGFCFRFPPPAPIGPLPLRAAGHPTFGSIQNWQKLNERCVELWSQVLASLPGSRLILAGAPREGFEWVLEAFAKAGLSRSRLELAGRLSGPDYPGFYRRVDVLLDTWPYSGVTTTALALGYGVPTLTLTGPSAASRQGASVLEAAGLGDWVARDPAELLRLAAAKTADCDGLAALRASLPDAVRRSALADGAGLAADLEALADTMVGEWLASARC